MGGWPGAILLADDEAVSVLVQMVCETHQLISRNWAVYGSDVERESDEIIGRIESVVSSVFCPYFGQDPSDRFSDAFEQTACFCEFLAKDHIFLDGNKRTAALVTMALIWVSGFSLDIADGGDPDENDMYRWIKAIVSGDMTRKQLADNMRRVAVRLEG